MYVCMGQFLKFCGGVSENQNCGAGWKDNQAADCEFKLETLFFFTSEYITLIQWLGSVVEFFWFIFSLNG